MEFLKIWEIILRRKWIIIITFCIFFVAIFMITNLIKPSYKANAKLLVETSNTLSSLLSTLGLQDTKTVSSQSSSSDSEQKTTVELARIRPLLSGLILSLNLKKKDGEVMEPEELIRSNFIDKFSPKPYVSVKQYNDADMLEITALSPDPKEAASIANKLAELYIQDRIRRAREENRLARLFLEEQSRYVKDDYYSALSNLKEFRVKEGAVDLTVEASILINKIATLKSNFEESERTIVEAERSIAKSVEELKKTEKFRKESQDFSENELLKTLKTKLNELLINISAKTLDVTKEHFDYKIVEKQIETVRSLMTAEVTTAFRNERFSIDPIYDSLTKKIVENTIAKEIDLAKRAVIQKYIGSYTNDLLRIPLKSSELSKLEGTVSVNKEIYQKLRGYLIQVGLAESLALSDIRLVEPAEVPVRPDFPKKPLNYILGVFLGLFWGLVAAFFIEYIDNTIKSPEDIKNIKSLTLIGTVPQTKHLKNMGLISTLDPTLYIVEAYRTIKNSIRYTSADIPLKTIAITSSIESEGKSSVASNLSITFSRQGKRVILVDLDLRKGSIHGFFDVPNNRGITDILAEGMRIEDTIAHSKVEGLDLLTSGPTPPDPSRIIESRRLKDIISALQERYDVVIIDTPSVMPTNDAIVIGRLTEGMLYIIESGKATFLMVEHGLTSMEKAGINIIGSILNKLKTHNLS